MPIIQGVIEGIVKQVHLTHGLTAFVDHATLEANSVLRSALTQDGVSIKHALTSRVGHWDFTQALKALKNNPQDSFQLANGVTLQVREGAKIRITRWLGRLREHINYLWNKIFGGFKTVEDKPFPKLTQEGGASNLRDNVSHGPPSHAVQALPTDVNACLQVIHEKLPTHRQQTMTLVNERLANQRIANVKIWDVGNTRPHDELFATLNEIVGRPSFWRTERCAQPINGGQPFSIPSDIRHVVIGHGVGSRQKKNWVFLKINGYTEGKGVQAYVNQNIPKGEKAWVIACEDLIPRRFGLLEGVEMTSQGI